MQSRLYYILLLLICGVSLFSKLWLVPYPTDYYFDEDYHIETAKLVLTQDMRAFEWWHEPLTYRYVNTLGRPTAIEWLHPPVAKYLQAASIWKFGDTPLGWRFPSAVSGAGITCLLLLIARRFNTDQLLTPIIGLVSVVDGLLFVQSRIATNDAVAAFFVLLTLYVVLKHLQQPRLFTVAQLGVTIGLGVATKWSVAFVLPAVLIGLWWFSSQHRQQRVKNMMLVLALCAVTYVSTYLPSVIYHGPQHAYDLHRQILTYQLSADFSHQYSAGVAEWALNSKPTKLYVHTQENSKSFIYNAQNPALAGLVLLSVGWLLHTKVVEKKRISQLASVTLIFSAATLVPWLFIQRPTFYYHYLPTSVLLSIPSSLFLVWMYRVNTAVSRTLYWLLLLALIGSFGWLLPIWTGTPLVNFDQHTLWWYMVPIWR